MRTAAGVLLFCLVFSALPAGAQESRYANELIDRARQLNLAEHDQWLTLGHYLPRVLTPGWVSVIDSPGFFLAQDGKNDPRAELVATLRQFFAPAPAKPEIRHPQCIFIARYHWLKSMLGFDSARLPERSCREFDEWYAAIDPIQVTLIFPAAYLNQPSSMFGHTLLRIDRRGQGERARLHSYAINYGAVTGDENGMIFAIKGLVGGYPGTYSIMPYYEKVKEYSDLESRDIWEYQLNLTQAEIRRLLMHVWEMGRQHAEYFFFDENCSYQLLSLLEVARPSLDLTDKFKLWAIPADTVRTVVAQTGLLKRAIYRPSARAGIDHRLSLLDGSQRDLAYRLALGEITPEDPAIAALAPPRRAALLELAYEYLRHRYRERDENRDTAAQRSLALLRARSQIPVDADATPVPTPKTRPDQGHDSAMIAMGGGVTDDDRAFVELRLRPAYHDLLDPQGGFVPGTQISFLDLRLRYFKDKHTVNLESLTVLEIQSLTPRNQFFKPFSFRFDTGVERFRRSGAANGDFAGFAGGGGGLSYAPWDNAILSGFAEGRITGAADLPNKVLVDLGPSLGLLYYPKSWWALHLQGRYGFALDASTKDSLEAGLEQSFSVTRWLAVRTETGVKGDADDPFLELRAALRFYF
ncbi:MAG: DUF4105 domain-containing protein [Alphaproteobacteria bacterium]|nr:DUF4105 domain-containing protein [Alphaproteobacteria bacterium]